MLSNFSQVAMLGVYAGTSVLLALLAYRVLPGFAWGGRGMDEAAGSGRIRQVDEADGPAGTAATSALNVMNNMTPGGMASLMCACMFMFGAIFGGWMLPAMFMAIEQPDSIQKALIVLSAIAWGVTLGSTTVLAIRIAISLLVVVLILVPIGAIGLFIFGSDEPLTVGGIEVSDMHGVRALEKRLIHTVMTEYMPTRYSYNLCTIGEAVFRWKGVPDISECAAAESEARNVRRR